MPASEVIDTQNNFGIGLQPIELPFFLSQDAINSATPFTYLALFLNLVFVVILIIWVVYIIRAAINIIQSRGESKPIEESQKKIMNIFISVGIMIGFYAVLTLVGAFFGIGGFFSWPKSFSRCSDGSYYFQKYFEDGEATDATCFQ